MVYRQLTQEQRYLIYKLRKAGTEQVRIAATAGVHPSTICRELRRNVNRRGYRPRMAHRLAQQRRRIPRRTAVLTSSRRVWVRHFLRRGWSPDQIAGRFRLKGPFGVSYQTIYRYLYADRERGGELYRHLRRKGRRYQRKRLGAGPLRNRRFIEERPACVDRRERLGDWELDTVVSSHDARAVIVTMVERVSQLVMMEKVDSAEAMPVAYAIIRRLGSIKAKVHTLTSDNGHEFAAHEYVARKLEADFYFARPYKPWQRALNEKTNGLIREFFPKGSPLGKLSQQEVTRVMQTLNTRPRKTLNYLTPNEIFYADVALGM